MVTPDGRVDLPQWGRGQIDCVWQLAHRDLEYINEPFNDALSVSQWRAQGFTQSRFTGDLYDMRQSQPVWMPMVLHHFNWRFVSWSVYRMTPGIILPEHRDTYVRFREIYRITNQQTIRRAVIFMEPWQSGHYFEIDGTPIVNWKCGEFVFWDNDTPHLAANLGTTDRYTLQITGVIGVGNQF